MSSSQESSLLSSGYEKLRTELSERTAEISKLRDQMSEQQQELERVYSKLQGQEEQHGSLEIINQELVCQLDEALTKGHYYLQKVLVINIYKLNTSSTPKIMGETVSLRVCFITLCWIGFWAVAKT